MYISSSLEKQKQRIQNSYSIIQDFCASTNLALKTFSNIHNLLHNNKSMYHWYNNQILWDSIVRFAKIIVSILMCRIQNLNSVRKHIWMIKESIYQQHESSDNKINCYTATKSSNATFLKMKILNESNFTSHNISSVIPSSSYRLKNDATSTIFSNPLLISILRNPLKVDGLQKQSIED